MDALATQTSLDLKNILYATDFSPAAESAMPFVLEIAKVYGSKVFAVHVRTPDSYALMAPAAFPYQTHSTQDAAADLAATLDQQLRGTRHELIIGDGEVWEFISRVLRDREIDLIVIGTQGRTGVEKFMLGSLAEVIFRQANCPVLTVGPHVAKKRAERWNINNILFATDFTPESLAGCPMAFSLARERGSRLTLVNVVEKSEVGDLVRPEHYVDSTVRMLRAQVPKDVEFDCHLTYFVTQGIPSAEILNVAEEIDADLIVLGVRPATGHLGITTHLARPTAHKVVSQALCPVLTVRG